jgi:hypothetical protein
VKRSDVQCREGVQTGRNEKGVYMGNKLVRNEGLGKSVCTICVGKNIRNYIQYFLPLVLFSLRAFLLTVCVLCVLLSSYVYLLYYVCTAVLL